MTTTTHSTMTSPVTTSPTLTSAAITSLTSPTLTSLVDPASLPSMPPAQHKNEWSHCPAGSKAFAGLSDDDLFSRIQLLTRQERRVTLKILLHLIEIERRRIYLIHGYCSLHDYCIRGLDYSESAAGRRIATARCIRNFPEVYGLLHQGRLNLTTVSMIAGVMNPQNCSTLLSEVCDKSRQEVLVVLSRYRPTRRSIPDRVTPVRVGRERRLHRLECWAAMWDAPPGEFDKWQEIYRRGGGGFDPTPEPQFKIEFAASPAFMEKFEEVKALLSTRSPGGAGLETLFETMMDEFIERHSPARRAERRKKRLEKREAVESRKKGQQKRKAPGNAPQKAHAAQRNEQGDPPQRKPGAPAQKARGAKTTGRHIPQSMRTTNRHIPDAVRDEVFLRDNSQCTFIGKTGTRCTATYGIEIDHIIPYAKGGSSSLDNLRLLCGQHNRFEAERAFGKTHIRQFYRRE